MKSIRLTERLTIRLSKRLAEALAEAALQVDQDESAFLRELLRRELLANKFTGGGGDARAARQQTGASA